MVLCFSPVNAKFADRCEEVSRLDYWLCDRLVPGLAEGGPSGRLRRVCRRHGDHVLSSVSDRIEHMAFVHNCVVECCSRIFSKNEETCLPDAYIVFSFCSFIKRVMLPS